MAESLDQIAKGLPPGPERAAFQYLSGQSGAWGSQGALIQDRTKVLTMAVEELLRFGLAGVRDSDRAFEALVGKLPTTRYNVFLTRAVLDTMARNIEEVPRKLQQTIREVETAMRSWRAGETNFTRADYEAHKRALEQQARRYRDLADRLKLHHAIPADPNKSDAWVREGY